jgi:imidazolonepropionase-like amidohydrolase
MQLSPYILAGWLIDGSAGPVQRKILLEIKNGHIAVIRRATEKDLAVGTDAGSLGVHHGEAVREEIEFLVVAGLGLDEAVQCATSKGAALLGLEDHAGRLVLGSPATFLAVRAEPERLLKALGSPEKVYLKGVPIPPIHSEWRGES